MGRRERGGGGGPDGGQARPGDIGQGGVGPGDIERARADVGMGLEPPAEPLAARRERAFELFCRGQRAPAIAREIGVAPGTVRRWLRARLGEVAREAYEERATALLRAIEGHREVARAAWEAYRQERAVEAAVLRGELDRVRRRAVRMGPRRPGRHAQGAGDAEAGEGDEGERVLLEEYERPRLPNQGARYLGVALAAQREAARLAGLYERAVRQPTDISITITRRPDGPENLLPGQSASYEVIDGGPGDEDEDVGEREDAGGSAGGARP